MNSVTAFVDASNVYGSTEEKAAMLREFSGVSVASDCVVLLHVTLPHCLTAGASVGGRKRALAQDWQ